MEIGDYLHGMIGTLLSSSWLIAIVAIGHLVTTMAGIKAGRRERPAGRGEFVLLLALLVGLCVIAGGSMAILAAGIQSDILLPICLLLADQVAQYFSVKWSVQRLRSIGWSPNWAWLLIINGVAAGVVLALCLLLPVGRAREPKPV